MPERKILVVDDVEFFLEVEKDFLRQTPATIFTARNGREALETAMREKPDLIYMDVTMPVMDGLACCRALKADPALRGIPVIIVFAPTADVDENACRAAGCDGVLTKPIDRRAFLELGHRFLFHIDRREPRFSCQALVTFRRGEKEFSATCEDLSATGIYVACREEVQVGEMLQITLVLPGAADRPLNCRGKVIWVNQGFPRPKMVLPQGFGLELQLLSVESATFLKEQMAKRKG